MPQNLRFRSFYSNLFLVSEKDGFVLPILDLKYLKEYVLYASLPQVIPKILDCLHEVRVSPFSGHKTCILKQPQSASPTLCFSPQFPVSDPSIQPRNNYPGVPYSPLGGDGDSLHQRSDGRSISG